MNTPVKTNVLTPAMIDYLDSLASKATLFQDEDADLYGACGGNYDDAYYIGCEDGAIDLAREVLAALRS